MRNRSSSRRAPAPPSEGTSNQGPYTLLFDVWLLAHVTQGVLDAAIAGSGISADEFALYSLIRTEGPLTPTELSRWTAIPPTTLSAVIRRLELRGHIQRLPHATDGRSYRVGLTDAGKAAHTEASMRCLPVLQRIEAALGSPPGEARQTLKEIERVIRAEGDLAMPVSRVTPTATASNFRRP